ncbi:MAG: preprotein translocase subunit YajC [Clostridiales bacterium]|nr:preprotein translocase subunit YajC [Clostridiales bacterium]
MDASSIVLLVLMIAIFYFLLIRPENKRKKQAEEMRSSLKKGDYITTIGGIYGRVVTVTDRTIVIETSDDRVRMEFIKTAVATVGTLDEQAAAAARPSKKSKNDSKEDLKAEEKPAQEEAPADEAESSDSKE